MFPDWAFTRTLSLLVCKGNGSGQEDTTCYNSGLKHQNSLRSRSSTVTVRIKPDWLVSRISPSQSAPSAFLVLVCLLHCYSNQLHHCVDHHCVDHHHHHHQPHPPALPSLTHHASISLITHCMTYFALHLDHTVCVLLRSPLVPRHVYSEPRSILH